MWKPFGLEENQVRRRPWVTYGVMIVCSVLFAFTHFSGHRRLQQGLETLDRALEFYQRHPFLTLDPRLRDPADKVGAPAGRNPLPSSGPAPEFVVLEQVELDGLTRSGFDSLAETPVWRLGFVPADSSIVQLVTHVFVHASLFHLLANLLFLYLTAPFLEDVWGRRFFAAFFLLAGVSAGVIFALRNPGLAAPLVGASGAAAGVVGAFLVRHWRHRIRLVYWFGAEYRRVLAVPGWALLPLGALREWLTAYSMEVVAPGAGSGEVAGWAHLGGLGFGACTAVLIRWFKIEGRHPVSAHRAAGPEGVRDGVGRAPEVPGRAPAEETWTLLSRDARLAPDDPEAVLALWDLAKTTGRTAEAGPVLARLLRSEIQRGRAADGYLRWVELRRHAPQVRVPLTAEAKLAELLSAEALQREAEEVATAAAEMATAELPAGTLLRLVRLAAGPARERVNSLVLSHPELPADVKAQIDSAARRAASRFSGSSAEASFAGPSEPRVWAMPAVPVELVDGRLVLDLQGQGRKGLSVERLRALATADVEGDVFLDLFLEPVEAGKPLRVVRFDSRQFDPRRLVPAEEKLEDAFLSLAGSLVAASGATWLLGGNALHLRRYASIVDYERDLCQSAGLGDR